MSTNTSVHTNLPTILLRGMPLLMLFASGGFAWAMLGSPVQVSASHPVPIGHAIVAKSSAGPLIRIPRVATQCFHTIRDLTLGSYGESLQVLGESPIPEGWVITHEHVGNPSTFNITYTLRCVAGAPTNDTLEVLYKSPIPQGWVVSGQKSRGHHAYPNYVIKNLNGQAAQPSAGTSSSSSQARPGMYAGPS